MPVDARDGRDLSVLPGRYRVQAPDTDPLFTAAGPAHVDVPAAADPQATPVGLQVPVRIRSQVVDQVDAQIRTFLNACVEQDTLTPPRGCPFQVPDIVIGADDVHWTLTRTPVIDVVPADDPGTSGPPAAVRTVMPGRVTVTYTAFTSAGGDRNTITQQLPVTIGGTVDADPAQPRRIVWSV